jgi:hypothetical protein
VSTIQASSMAVTFYIKITLRPGSVFCFGTISSVADEEGILHRIADPPERKSPPTNSKNIGEAQPPALRKKIVSEKSGAEGSLTRKTPLSTSPTKEWTRIARKKETREKQIVLSVPPASKENRKKVATTAAPFYPDILFIGRVESPAVSDDEPTAPGEEPPQRESRRRRNRRRNVRRHHAAGERDPEQPVSRDEVSEIGETPEERVFRERRNSRRRDRRRAQEQAEQDARQRWENPFFGRNLNPDFARAMNTPSEVGGVLARIADGLPRTPDAEGYRRLFTQAANHLLPLAHPPNDLRHAINSRRDARSSINASRERRHENEIRRREEYDRDHGTRLRARPPELSRQRPQLAEPPGDGRGTTTTTPLPGTDIVPDDRRTRAEYPLLPRALGPFNGLPTSRYPMSTNMNLSRIQGMASCLHHRCSSCRGVRRRDDCVFTHRPWARRATMAATSTPTLHQQLGGLQSTLHRQLLVPLRQAGATMGPQIHQAPGG